jgi:hypothetical protein
MQRTRNHHDVFAVFLKKRLAARILLLIILLASSLLMQLTQPVFADSISPSSEGNPATPTTIPASHNSDQTVTTSPLVGVLVLLAPLVFIAWKSRGLKEPKVTASCCAPVIDENKRPFQIQEDMPASQKAGK